MVRATDRDRTDNARGLSDVVAFAEFFDGPAESIGQNRTISNSGEPNEPVDA